MASTLADALHLAASSACAELLTFDNRGYAAGKKATPETASPSAKPGNLPRTVAVIDLASKAERERLSPSALKAFFNIVDRWGVRDEDARHLLGGVTNGPYYEMKKNPKAGCSTPTNCSASPISSVSSRR